MVTDAPVGLQRAIVSRARQKYQSPTPRWTGPVLSRRDVQISSAVQPGISSAENRPSDPLEVLVQLFAGQRGELAGRTRWPKNTMLLANRERCRDIGKSVAII